MQTAAIPVQNLDMFYERATHGFYEWAPEFLNLGYGLPTLEEVEKKPDLTTIEIEVMHRHCRHASTAA